MRLQPTGTKIFKPSVATAWGQDEVFEDHGGEVAVVRAEVHTVKHFFVVLFSENPSHYSYVYVRNIEGVPRHIEYKDSSPSKSAHQVATNLLRNLELIPAGSEAPPSCNTSRQIDGWSCGI